MTTRHDAQDNAEMWDNRKLGASEEHAEAVNPSLAAEFDDMMELQAISIRLQKSLLNNLKPSRHITRLIPADGQGFTDAFCRSRNEKDPD